MMTESSTSAGVHGSADSVLTSADVALRRELESLRAENSRLRRLLQITKQDTAPADEQPAAPLTELGALSMTSEPARKVAFFRSLFQSRPDRYAVRWENRRDGRSGWMPAVAGRWRKGMDPQTAQYLPLTNEVVTAHLTGDVFIGFYPLLDGDGCHWLAADFDGPMAMLDALAYIKAARGVGVPTALEISQSGAGAHVWIFFTEKVPAESARNLGTALINQAVKLRGTMSLRSYDRLFPSQDTLPSGGVGNLIAAPLYGQRRRDGLTAFLDLSTLEPWEDQWDFLSTLDRLSPGQLRRATARAGAVVVGTAIDRLSLPSATKTRPQLPPVIPVTLAAGLRLSAQTLNPAALATFKHASSMRNPKFYELQRLRKSTWDTPRFLQGFDESLEGDLILPRGLRHLVESVVRDAGSRLDVTDERVMGTEIDVDFTATLRSEQSAAVNSLLAHDDGILVAAPGSGKTVMACAMIAERAVSTLVLVDRRALADQWRARLREFLGFQAGQIGGGRSKTTGIVDVALLPTLARRSNIAEITAPYGQVVVDECHHLAAAAYDHSIKQVPARFWLGLTATPRRRDRLDDLVRWQLGPVRHTFAAAPAGTLALSAAGDTSAGPTPVLQVHRTQFTLPQDTDATEPGGMAAIYRMLIDDDLRNELILDHVVEALERHRKCLVLTRRTAHLESLAEVLQERGHAPITLRGGMSAEARRRAVQQIEDAPPDSGLAVIGTAPYIGEGFDAANLDTLFLAMPVSFDGLLIQYAGRVLRAHPGKDTAEVHDFFDSDVPVLAASYERRKPGYRALGFLTPKEPGPPS